MHPAMLTQYRAAASQPKGATPRGLLLSALGWWDAADYTSGAWANKGTAGSALNFTRGAAAANPSFASGEFTFDGVDDYMYIADTATLDVAAGESLTFGVIMNPVVTVPNGKRIISKDTGTGQTYLIRGSSGTSIVANFNDGTSSNFVGCALPTVGVYSLMAAVRDCAANLTWCYNGTSNNGSAALTSEAAINNAAEFRIGGIAANFTNMKVKAAFLFKRALTIQQINSIKSYYNV